MALCIQREKKAKHSPKGYRDLSDKQSLTSTVCSLYPRVPCPQMQPTLDAKYSDKYIASVLSVHTRFFFLSLLPKRYSPAVIYLALIVSVKTSSLEMI